MKNPSSARKERIFTEDEFYEIKECQDREMSPLQIAKETDYSIISIGLAFQYENFEDYTIQHEAFQPKEVEFEILNKRGPDESKKELKDSKKKFVEGIQKRRDIELATDETVQTDNTVAVTISRHINSLWAISHFLEVRKNELEIDIRKKENQLRTLTDLIDKLNDA